MPENQNPSEAIVICTRNRPVELRHTLTSIGEHPPSGDAMLIVVDASDLDTQAQNRETLNLVRTILSVHWPYAETPSLPRQRNYALDRLPSSVDIVHFLDDDVTVHADYFDALTRTLEQHPDVGGVGGHIYQPKTPPASPTWFRRLFLLSSVQDGAVLPSGCAESAQLNGASANAPSPSQISTQWLSGCSCTFRRDLLQRHRFATSMDGYALLEDLEFSYRVGQDTSLLVVPEATLTHRVSNQNRHDLAEYIYAAVLHRYWFVTTTLTPNAGTLPFWWAFVGEVLACTFHPHGSAKLRGLVRALKSLLIRNHSLLSS
jgi:GT2 family glycosyltransferase